MVAYRFLTLAGELGLVALATVVALLLRDNFETSAEHLSALAPYLVSTLFVCSVVFPALGVSRSLWRHTSIRDGLTITAAAVAAAIGAVMLGFSFNRLDGVPRSLPILQAASIAGFLLGARLLARLSGHARDKVAARAAAPARAAGAKTVLVVGAGRLADLYLRCVDEFAPDTVRVAGVLGDHAWQIGRAMRGAPIVGTTENLLDALKTLEVHGVFVDAVVAAAKIESFSPRARAALLEAERSGRVTLEFLADQMELALCVGEDEDCRTRPAGAPDLAAEPALTLAANALECIAARPIWAHKRRIDICLGLLLLVVLSPVMLIVSIGVLIDVGLPMTFWQQRPGRDGRAFRLHKFRTMGAAHDDAGRRRPDADRLSAFGAFLRRSRLDELPQLVDILRGDMSFIGPRPLLPVDQPGDSAARLAVRPGLTGWAQVKGGRHVSVADKTALDLWYLRNASLWLDACIFAATARVVLQGDAVDSAAIERAWRDLREGETRAPRAGRRPVLMRAVTTPHASAALLRRLAAAGRRAALRLASGDDRS